MPALQGCQDQTCKQLWEHLALCGDTVGGNSMPSAFPWGQWMSETGSGELFVPHVWESGSCLLKILSPSPYTRAPLLSLSRLSSTSLPAFELRVHNRNILMLYEGKWPSPGPPPAAAVETQHCSVSRGVWPLALPRLQDLAASHLRPTAFSLSYNLFPLLSLTSRSLV